MKHTRRLFDIFKPLLLAILIEIIAIFVSSLVRHNFDSLMSTTRDCGGSPDQFPTAFLMVVGFIIAIIGTIRVFRMTERPAYIFSGMALLLLTFICGGIAEYTLNILAGWCF